LNGSSGGQLNKTVDPISKQVSLAPLTRVFILNKSIISQSDIMYSIDQDRRNFILNAGKIIAGGGITIFGLGMKPIQGSPSSMVTSALPIKQIKAGVLNIGYAEAGPADGTPVILLHGWPYDIHSFSEVIPQLTKHGFHVYIPHMRGYGTTTFLEPSYKRNGQQSAFAVDMIAFLDALDIKKAVIAGFDWGARTACIMAAQFPQRCKALVSVSGYLIGNPAAGKMPLLPSAELQWWYQFYFSTERGRLGYASNRKDFARLIWKLASPGWNFSDATFQRSALSLNNPDHVDIVIHNYRWRLGLEEGESRYDDIERSLANAPVITVPTITIEGDNNGAPHPLPSAYTSKFSGKYKHILFKNTGHNPPQEAPERFANAIVEVNRM
jgi:pimeloyl-ACP methyl ester carboxylesterase